MLEYNALLEFVKYCFLLPLLYHFLRFWGVAFLLLSIVRGMMVTRKAIYFLFVSLVMDIVLITIMILYGFSMI